MKLGKFSIGTGDRFSHQGEAQLRAIMRANEKSGLAISIVWNKSNREHTFLHTVPQDTRNEADAAVKALGFTGKYYVDADHINSSNVAGFVDSSDYFTIDVASFIGKESTKADVDAFIAGCSKYVGNLAIPGIAHPQIVTNDSLVQIANKFLAATQQVAHIYTFLVEKKGQGNFITEVSIDEVEKPQTPIEMFFILKMLADKKVPVQTIAPKFSGPFYKGIDYMGDVAQFTKEFEEDVLVLDFAVKEFGLPDELKLSVHSGSDKFSIYKPMADIMKKYDKGLHVKTTGTTWLEEVIGLAKAGGDGLDCAKEIYTHAFNRSEELCAPYVYEINIDMAKLPSVEEVSNWSSEKFVNTLSHVPGHPDYNPNFRQLVHVSYKVAYEMGDNFFSMIEKHAKIIGDCVEKNIYDRHLKILFDL